MYLFPNTTSGAGAMGHGWARAHPLFINVGHEGACGWAQTQAIRSKESTHTRKRAIAKALHLEGRTTSRQTLWAFRVCLV